MTEKIEKPKKEQVTLETIVMQTDVIISELSEKELLRVAGRIDNTYFSARKSFTSERKSGYYYLSTNRCDESSFIKIFCDIGVPSIQKIEILGSYTDGWDEVHPNTYKRVESFLNEECA